MEVKKRSPNSYELERYDECSYRAIVDFILIGSPGNGSSYKISTFDKSEHRVRKHDCCSGLVVLGYYSILMSPDVCKINLTVHQTVNVLLF